MGSEFAYEDISSQEIAKYNYKWIKDETIDGRESFLIERYPTYKHSGYTRQMAWIDKERYQPNKIMFYDRKNTLLKTLTYHEFNQYKNQFWRPGRMEMVNHQTGKSTTLTWKNYRFQTGLSERDFNRNSLKRAR